MDDESFINGYLNQLKDPNYSISLYQEIPEKFKKDPRIKEAYTIRCIRIISNNSMFYFYMDEKFKKDPRIKEAFIQQYAIELKRGLVLAKDIPKEFRNDPRFAPYFQNEVHSNNWYLNYKISSIILDPMNSTINL